jgi:glycosyltransferase involved in cell wall biosynthesis
MFGFTRIPEPLIKYRIREGSITQSKADEQRMYCDIARKKFADRHPEFRETRVTVGVPVYNPSMSHLKECLDSIKGQTRKPHEVIVLDDGSKNREEIEKFVKGYGFKYFHQENKGIGGARNAIIDRMSEDSDYLCYLSDDDVMYQEYIDIMCRAEEQSKGCIMYSDFVLIQDNGQVITQYEAPRFDDFEDFCVCCLSQAEKDVMFVNFSTTFFPAETIRRERFDDSFTFGEDLEFLLRTALAKKCRYVHVPGFMIKIRMHAASTTSKKEDEIPKNNALIFKKIGGLMGWQS